MKEFEKEWSNVIDFFKKEFTQGETPEMDTILFLIGIQELGQIKPEFSKDEKVNLMHIATCKLLEPYGYYQFEKSDKEGWPFYKKLKPLNISVKEQENIMKQAIINYFKINNIIK